jgi:hypothetical protein
LPVNKFLPPLQFQIIEARNLLPCVSESGAAKYSAIVNAAAVDRGVACGANRLIVV